MKRMVRGKGSFVLVVCALAGALLVTGALVAQQRQSAPAAAAAPDYEAAMANLRFRSIGPAIMGGRVDDFAVVESDPSIVYVGMASGGVWKTTNGGTTWEPLFDEQPVSTIGDVTVAPSDPSIVWVGTGEPNNRQSSSWGNGVYKSTDAGKTWQHMGLAATQSIGRIVIHPTDPNTLYVAAVGALWGPSRERGVYKTTDGGRSWTNVLFVNEDTGVVDIAMDHQSPGTLLAAAYQRRRTVFGFNGSGPHGGIYKTTDGGANWKKVEKGLPWDPNPPRAGAPGTGFGGFGGGGGGQQAQAARPAQPREEEPQGPQEIGRIGINFYRKDTTIVYALVEHRNGGTFRSEDKGETWTKMSDTNPRPMYYSKIHIDPTNDQRIWVLGAQMFYSDDGGRTFRQNLVQRIHGDYHAMWINPKNSDQMITGSDGGIHWSWDRGRTWDFIDDIPLGQFYEVHANMDTPYMVCGGLQDNNTWCGPSATLYSDDIPNGEWFTIGGGDGFYAQFDPYDKNIVYAESQDGNLLRRDLRTHESKSIRPQEGDNDGRFRFQWNSPIMISAFDPKTIYYGGNFVFKSTDRGDNWTKMSPDLTNNQERDKLPIMGKVPDGETMSRHDGVQQWPSITTIAESPRNKDVVWAGTDDGNLQVTRDGGKSWKNVADKVPGVPKGTYVSRIEASHQDANTAYVAFDGHRTDDTRPYLFVTRDRGRSWTSIASGLPADVPVKVVRAGRRNPELLFAGTETGLWMSLDAGRRWMKMPGLPTVPVDDLLIHPRDLDLIVGTHGRSLYILDGIQVFEEWSPAALRDSVSFFTPKSAWTWVPRALGHKWGQGEFAAKNPPFGAWFDYFLPQEMEDGVSFQIQDANGRVVRKLSGGSGLPGFHRVTWDLLAGEPSERIVSPANAGQPQHVAPGRYKAVLTAGKARREQWVEVRAVTEEMAE